MSWYALLYALLKYAHILCALAMISGMVGRTIVRLRIPGATSMPALQELVGLVGRFDDALVIRGSQLTLVTGLLLGWVGGWSYITASHPTWIFVSLILFLSILPLVVAIFLPRGKVFAKVFQQAIAEQKITPELRAALADPLVRAATVYEFVAIAIVLYLMVFKPF